MPVKCVFLFPIFDGAAEKLLEDVKVELALRKCLRNSVFRWSMFSATMSGDLVPGQGR